MGFSLPTEIDPVGAGDGLHEGAGSRNAGLNPYIATNFSGPSSDACECNRGDKGCAPSARTVDAALDITYRYCENSTMTEAVQSPGRSPDSLLVDAVRYPAPARLRLCRGILHGSKTNPAAHRFARTSAGWNHFSCGFRTL